MHRFGLLLGWVSRGLFVLAVAAGVRAQQIHVGPSVQVSPWDGQHTYDEVRIAADPYDSRYIVACAMPQHDGVAAFASEDGGAHWKQTLLLPNGTDPECEFGNHGDAYLVTGYSGLTMADMKLVVFWSGDHGTTWEQRQVLPFGDRPAISVDRTDQLNRGTLYVLQNVPVHLDDDAGSQASPTSSEVYASRDEGKSFEATLNLHYERNMKHGNNYLLPSHAAILSDGSVVYVDSIDCSGNTFGVPCYRSPALLAYGSEPDTNTHFQLLSTTKLPTSVLMIPELAAAPGGPFKDRLFGVYCGPVDENADQRLYLIVSGDGGKTWSTPLQVAPANGPCLMPMVAANNEGVVGISWYAGKAARHFTATQVDPRLALHAWTIKDMDVRCDVDERFTASLDGGKTLLPNVIVNPVSDPRPIQFVPFVNFDDRFDPKDAQWGFGLSISYTTTGLGDTEGLTVAPDGSFYPAWVDFRTGVGMVRTAKISVVPPTVTEKAFTPAAEAAPDVCRAPDEPKLQFTTVAAPKTLPPEDITFAYHAYMLNSSYDKEHNAYTMDIQLEGPVGQLGRGVYLQVSHGSWPADTAFLNADNGERGAGARWLFKAKSGDAGSNPRVRSEVRHIRLYVPPLSLHSSSPNFYLRVLKPDA